MKRWPESRTPHTMNTLFRSLRFLYPDNKENEVLVAQSGLTPCDPMDYSRPGSSDHGILQERILEWVAILFSSLLQGIFVTQGSNPALLYCRQILTT